MAQTLSFGKRTQILMDYISEKPTDEQAFAGKHAVSRSTVNALVEGWAKAQGISTRSALDMARMGVLSPDEVTKYWRQPQESPSEGRTLEADVADLTKEVKALLASVNALLKSLE